MIILDKEEFLAKGSHRAIFLYPNDKNKCIKVVFSEGQKALRKRNKHWYKRIRPLSWFNENKKEIKAYKKLQNKNDIIYNFIPRFYGEIKTNLGKGIVIDYIDNASCLKKYIIKSGINENLIKALHEIFDTFLENNIQIRDPHLDNFLIKELDNGELKIFFIDGLGNNCKIPFSDWFDFLGRIQIKRRIKKLINNIKKEFPEYINNNLLENF